MRQGNQKQTHATEETGVREITEGHKLYVHFLWVRNSKSLCNLPEQIFVADDCTSVSYLNGRKGNTASLSSITSEMYATMKRAGCNIIISSFSPKIRINGSQTSITTFSIPASIQINQFNTHINDVRSILIISFFKRVMHVVLNIHIKYKICTSVIYIICKCYKYYIIF
jgi:hypothetical protein